MRTVRTLCNDICTVHTLEICMNMFVILTIFIWLRIKHTLGNNTNEHYKETVKSLINDGWRITTMKFFTWLVCVRNALVWYWERKCLTVEIILLKTSLVRTGFSSSMFFFEDANQFRCFQKCSWYFLYNYYFTVAEIFLGVGNRSISVWIREG